MPEGAFPMPADGLALTLAILFLNLTHCVQAPPYPGASFSSAQRTAAWSWRKLWSQSACLAQRLHAGLQSCACHSCLQPSWHTCSARQSPENSLQAQLRHNPHLSRQAVWLPQRPRPASQHHQQTASSVPCSPIDRTARSRSG